MWHASCEVFRHVWQARLGCAAHALRLPSVSDTSRIFEIVRVGGSSY